MEPTMAAGFVTELIKLALQGTPYGLLALGLFVVWGKYQQSLKDIKDLHALQLKQQNKIINVLLGKTEIEEE